MNRFNIFSCIEVSEDDYEGPCVVMACVTDPAFMLFFPVSDENAKVISYVMDGNSDYDINTNILGLYKTMINSWKSSDRYLSGIIMDSNYDSELDEPILMIRLALAGHDGYIDSLVRVNFLHAILIAAMENVSIIVSDDLINQMLPPDFPDDIADNIFEEGEFEEEEDQFGYPRRERSSHNSKSTRDKSDNYISPEDPNIVDIARKIMSGKIKDKEGDKDTDKETGKEK